MIPLRFGTSEEFAALRDFLKDSDYTEVVVCKRLGVDAMYEFKTAQQGREAAEISDRLDFLIRLFMDGENVTNVQIRSIFPPAEIARLKALGLLASDSSKPELCYSPVVLYPTQSLYLVSDRWNNLDRSPFEPSNDFVYPAITLNTRRFLEMLPTDPCESFLDLCSGTGVAALAAAAHYAQHAWATDITERSARFAEFNRMLNGLTNVTVTQGDLYEPVGERTFDRIVAHPPYVPVLKPKWIFHDGGEDGEQVTKRIVEGLPRCLRPGGRFYCLTLGTEREGKSFEQRIRRWLGEKESEFDVLLIVRRIEEPAQFAIQSTVKTQGVIADVGRWKALFERHKVKNLVYGSVVIQRKNSTRAPFTARRQRGANSGPAEAEWLLRWEAASASPEIVQSLLESRPIASPNLELLVHHRMQDGALSPMDFTLQTKHPFSMECKVQPWMGFLVARCDGTKTALEHFETCKQDNLIHPDTPVEEFASLLRVLISGGFLEIEGFRPPAAKGQ